MATLLSATMRGLIIMALSTPEIAEYRAEASPFGAARKGEWSPGGLGHRQHRVCVPRARPRDHLGRRAARHRHPGTRVLGPYGYVTCCALTCSWGNGPAAACRRRLRGFPSRRGPTGAKPGAHVGSSDDGPGAGSAANLWAGVWPPARRRHGSSRIARRTSGSVRCPGRGRRSPPAAPGNRAARIRPNIGGPGDSESDPGQGHGGRHACGAATGRRPRQVLEPLR